MVNMKEEIDVNKIFGKIENYFDFVPKTPKNAKPAKISIFEGFSGAGGKTNCIKGLL